MNRSENNFFRKSVSELPPMTALNKQNIHGEVISKGLLLNCTQLSGTELDYEDYGSIATFEDNTLETPSAKPDITATGVAEHPEISETIKSDYCPSKEVHRPQQTSIEVSPQIHKESMTIHVLDIQRMADNFARAKMGKLKEIEKIVYDPGSFNYEVVSRVDKLLEEAYNILHTFQKKLDFTTRAMLLNLILALNELPHLHYSTHRDKGKCARVADWLNYHTRQPEPELCGFSIQDPVQLRKFVANIQPRLSSSDTNVTLGKRKRGCEDSVKDGIIGVQKSSSDTRVYGHADWSRSNAIVKRKRLRN